MTCKLNLSQHLDAGHLTCEDAGHRDALARRTTTRSPRYERLLIAVAVGAAFSAALLGLLMLPVRSALAQFLDYLGIGVLLYLFGRTVFRLFIRRAGADSAPAGATYEWLLDAAARHDEERGGRRDVRN